MHTQCLGMRNFTEPPGDQPRVNRGQPVRFEELEAIPWTNNGRDGLALHVIRALLHPIKRAHMPLGDSSTDVGGFQVDLVRATGYAVVALDAGWSWALRLGCWPRRPKLAQRWRCAPGGGRNARTGSHW